MMDNLWRSALLDLLHVMLHCVLIELSDLYSLNIVFRSIETTVCFVAASECPKHMNDHETRLTQIT